MNVAIVGCGRMGTQRARAAHQLGATVVLGDRNGEEANRLADEFPDGTASVMDGEPDWGAVDAVFVCTPPSERGPVEAAAARADVPVFVEKPIALSAREALPMLEAFQSAELVNAVGYMNRYRTGVASLRDALAGLEVFAVECHWIGNPYLKEWWPDPRLSGSPFNDQATHLIDVCRYVAGDVTDVAALERRSRDRGDIADVVAVSLRFANGACGSLLYSYRARDKFVSANFFTSAGCSTLEGWDFRLAGEEAPPPAAEPAPLTPIFLTETEAFFDAVQGGAGTGIRCTFADAYRTQLVVDAVHRSIASGCRESVYAG
jgi:myo-inositol 2-dehydrogenase / D-chiro-inositol 1-dehydrogenase